MYSVDRTNFISHLSNFPKQIEVSQEIVKKTNLTFKTDGISNILFAGMGGSAIAGDILKEYLFDQLTIPIEVIRGYEVPASCNQSTLFIASSYSGNTEETISALKQAGKKKSQILAISSGGEVTEMCKKKRWPLVVIPGGMPPRQAFGYSFFTALFVLAESGYIKIDTDNIGATVKLLKTMVDRNHYQKAEGKMLSQEIARRLHGKIPIIYSSTPYLESLSRRWQNQFHENSKSMAFRNFIPEMNHNEIVGWQMEHSAVKNFVVIFIKDSEINPRIKSRIDLTMNIIKDRGIEIIEVYPEGDTRLQRLMSLIALGDWISYYLAIDYKKDPMEILNIDYLKSELKKLS